MLRNKRASWKKAASGSSKITDWFLAINTSNSSQDEADDNYELPFDEAVDSSDDDDNKFTLASLDTLLKKKPDDVRLRTVSQFLHLVQDQRLSKLPASELLARIVNRGLWHARVIHS